ncbi:MAG: U32 family peptidase, partial [Methanobrevibacter sp.]|nr:U32 family peptidase [Candidatus Methanovirga basalitermitum]
GQYRIEVPGIQDPVAMHSLISAIEEQNLIIHRVTQTKGIMLLSDDEILEMNDLAIQNKIELFLSVGPRATYDTSATAQTKEGSRIAYRLRGYDNLVYGIEDVKRAISLGVRGILLYDEGLLYSLNKLRKIGEIPSDVHFKISAHTGHGNPASAILLEQLGADSFNPVRDLSIAMLSNIRQNIDIPLDVHAENPKSSGGFIRHYEVPEIIKVTSPVYLKTGGSVAQTHNWETSPDSAKQRTKQVGLVMRMINEYYPDVKISKKSNDLAIPKRV